MSLRRTLFILCLLAHGCALTTRGTTGSDDGGVGRDVAVADETTAMDVTPDQDVSTLPGDVLLHERQSDAGVADPRCPSLPCLRHPILRSSERGMLLARPDGRTFRWGAFDAVQGAGSDVFRTPTAWAQIPRATLEVRVGISHACALTAFDGRVYCWGQNWYGQLGDGTPTARDDARPVMQLDRVDEISVTSSGGTSWAIRGREVWFWGAPRETGPVVPFHYVPLPLREVVLDRPIARLSIGEIGRATAAILDDGSVRVWGLSQRGSLGLPQDSPMLPPTPLPLPGPARTITQWNGGGCALLMNGTVYCWGGFHATFRDPRVESGMLATPTLVPEVDDLVDFQSGGNFKCGLTRQQQVRCWGLNTRHGQLGYGSGQEEWVPPPGRIVDLPPVREIAVSSANVCVLTMSDEVYCWGQFSGGAVGVVRVPATPPGPTRVAFPE